MCLMCNCPQPLPPPNQKIDTCRKMLQALAAGLFLIGIVGLLSSFVFQLLYDLLLIYMLYIGWTTFNWCITLTFFLFCTMQTIQAVIVMVGMIEYSQLFSSKKTILLSIYCILTFVYYPVAVYFSHYCYKNFKNNFQGNNQIFPFNGQGGNQGGQINEDNQNQQQNINANYNRLREEQNQNRPNNNYFQGEGVRIG